MALTPGTKLGSYEVIASIGTGGMGEVYRARDLKLGREVAVKILPDLFASDPDRVARFEREAKSLAALNHPNIAQVYGFEERALVMELLEGETLRERLRAGALPVRKAIDYAAQIARGLAAAHDRGIIHRDLKPENVFVSNDGHVKILDFGLARDVARPASGASETIAAPRHTDPGTVMGTVGYMAPEQVREQALDGRADLFALGAVLYEMLTGRRAFQRDTTAETMTAILKEDPPELAAARADLSPALDRIVRHCLEKNPIERFQTARDVAFALDSLSGSGSGAAVAAAVAISPRLARERWMWAAATAGLAALLAWQTLAPRRPAETRPGLPYRLTLLLPEGIRLSDQLVTGARLAISPDSKRVVFTGVNGANNRTLWLHSLIDGSTRELAGTELAAGPTWSPDGKWIAFGLIGSIGSGTKKIAVDGGPPVVLASAGGWLAWSKDDVLLVEPVFSEAVLSRTTAAGGPLTPLLPRVINGGTLGYLSFLPDGRHFLHQYLKPGAPQAESGTYLASLDSADRQLLVPGPNVSQSVVANGALIYARGGTLFAQPFDDQLLKTTGEPVVLTEGVEQSTGGAAFSVSQAGTLVYEPNQENIGSRLVWMNRSGVVQSTLPDEADYSNLELSRDGRRLLVSVLDPLARTRDIYIIDIIRNVRQRLTFDPSDERSAVWSRDDQRVFYTSRGLDLYQRAANFTGGETAVQTDHRSKDPREVSPDGKWLLYRESGADTSNDMWRLPLDGSGKPELVVGTPFNENGAAFSPDGKSMVYQSDESGQFEIYVLSLDKGGGKKQLSTDNGTFARWRRDGKEIFYLNGERMLVSVPVKGTGAHFEAGQPTPLFRMETQPSNGSVYDVTSDGQRFIVNAPIPSKVPPHLVVIVNWPSLMKKQ
ncbi:MAG: protein kinase [Vicinamibacterales bacterium]